MPAAPLSKLKIETSHDIHKMDELFNQRQYSGIILAYDTVSCNRTNLFEYESIAELYMDKAIIEIKKKNTESP